MDTIFKASIRGGKIRFDDFSRFTTFLKAFGDQVVEVIIRKPRKPRSTNQNSYMWGVVYQLISETTGYIPDEVHDAMRLMFLLDRSRVMPTLRSTTELSTVEMEEYLEQIRMFAATDLNCVIPLPNEVDFTGE